MRDDSAGRWWEIHGEGRPDEAGYRELVTDSRGRSRPERSLSVGADLADTPRHPARAFLWPVVSVVAAAGLILSGIYVSTDEPTSPTSATSAQPAAQGGVPQAPAPASDAEEQRSERPAPSDNRPATDTGAPPIDTRAGIPSGPAAAPSAPAVNPSGPAVNPSAPVGAPTGSSGKDTGNQPTPSAAVPGPVLKLDGRAPAAPGPQPARRKVAGTGGCTISQTSEYYDCTIDQAAPYYLAETADPRGPLRAKSYPFFVCQSAGSKYSVGERANNWWAWLALPLVSGAWVPVVFLKGAPDNARAPGLPVCAGSPTPTTAPPTGPAAMNVVDRQTRRCLDSNENGDVYALECNGGDYQKWVRRSDGTVRDKKTGRCLDSNENGEVYTLDCNGGDYQKWERRDDGTIRDKKTGRCLDSNDNGKVYTLDCNGGNYQKWDIK